MELKAAGTAWVTMLQVALEQLVPDEQRIIHDPLAYRLLPAPLKGLVNLCRIDSLRQMLLSVVDRRGPGIRGGLLCRKRYVDEKLKEALEAGIQLVVILGAGFDTRAYRIPELTSLQVYEVDLPQNIRSKKKALQRLFGRVPAHVKLVSVDFDHQELEGALQQAGYSGEQPGFFILEGVTQYIAEGTVQKIFEFLRKAPPESRLVFTYVRKDFIEGKHLYGLGALYHEMRVKTQLWQFGLEPEAAGTFLRQYAWKELEQAGNVEYEERYLKPVKRVIPLMEVERIVYAERAAN